MPLLVPRDKMNLYMVYGDYKDKVYLTVTIRCGFAYRYVYFIDELESREVNQGFPGILALYIHDAGSTALGRRLIAKTFRGNISVTMESDAKHWEKDAERLYTFLFRTGTQEKDFHNAKHQAMTNMTDVYAQPLGKALYHLLEFSDKCKGFQFSRLSRGMSSLDFETFERYRTDFVHPGNADILVGCGKQVQGGGRLALPRMNRPHRPFVLCAEEWDPLLQHDAHKVMTAAESTQVRCMKFFFSQLNGTSEQRRLLLDILAGIIYQNSFEVNVDAFDSSISYWGETVVPRKTDLRSLFSNENAVQESRELALRYLRFGKTGDPMSQFSWLGALTTDGVDIGSYMNALRNCTPQSLTELFDKVDPVVTEGKMILKRYQRVKEG